MAPAGGVQGMLDAGLDRPTPEADVPEDLLVPSTSAPSSAPQDRYLSLHCVFDCPTSGVLVELRLSH